MQLATRCEVFFVLFFLGVLCSNASVYSAAKCLFLGGTGSDFATFVNVKYAAPGAGFYRDR